MLFLTQAAMEMDGRWMLTLVLLSLCLGMEGQVYPSLLHPDCRLPCVCYSVSQAVSIPAMLVAAVLLAVAASSAAYTAYRFDRMHRTATELELMVEAQYAEARRRCLIQTWQKNELRAVAVSTLCRSCVLRAWRGLPGSSPSSLD